MAVHGGVLCCTSSRFFYGFESACFTLDVPSTETYWAECLETGFSKLSEPSESMESERHTGAHTKLPLNFQVIILL